MEFVFYILYSASLDRFYSGISSNLEDRLYRHNNSGSKSTKHVNDWELVHEEKFKTYKEACQREFEVKKKKSRKYIEYLISG